MNMRTRGFVWLVGVALTATVATAPASAEEPRGLGSRWPSAADASRNPSFHAYRWIRGGVSYVQINDSNGNPLMAIASGSGTVIVLPVGDAAGQVRVVGQVAGPSVYRDDKVAITYDQSGFAVQSLEAQPCTDPVECAKVNGAAVAPAASTIVARPAVADETCTDPVECAK